MQNNEIFPATHEIWVENLETKECKPYCSLNHNQYSKLKRIVHALNLEVFDAKKDIKFWVKDEYDYYKRLPKIEDLDNGK